MCLHFYSLASSDKKIILSFFKNISPLLQQANAEVFSWCCLFLGRVYRESNLEISLYASFLYSFAPDFFLNNLLLSMFINVFTSLL